LATLYAAANGRTGDRREFSLVESRLKKLAQERCRSNLYDQQARGRNAFACVETLVDKGLVRKELIPGSEESKFSLLVPGEEMGRFCYEFEDLLERTIRKKPMIDEQQAALRGLPCTSLELIIDQREDASFAERLEERSREARLTTIRKDLPAGDYVFTVTKTSSDETCVLPLVIERKSWSDLADSVTGNGRSRLECVRMNRGSLERRQTCSGSCQLCRMKRTGFRNLMFIIEGARCLGRDHDVKCRNDNPCKYCREIMERHGSAVRHQELESVVEELQVKHGCIIHFTRSYNETIDSLLQIKEILSRHYNNGTVVFDSYETYCSNTRRRSDILFPVVARGKALHFTAEAYVKSIHKGAFREYLAGQLTRLANGVQVSVLSLPTTRTGGGSSDNLRTPTKGPAVQQAFGGVVLEIDSDDSDQHAHRDPDLDESDDEIQVLSQRTALASVAMKQPNTKERTSLVNLASESDDEIEVIDAAATKPRSNAAEESVVIIVENPRASPYIAGTTSTSR